MSAREITALAIKFFAIWLLVNVIVYVPSLIFGISSLESATEQELNRSVFIGTIVSFVLAGVIASLLLFRISNSILGSVPNSEARSESSLGQQYFLQLMGVYFAVNSLSSLPGVVMRLFVESEYALSNYLYIAGDLFMLGVGVYLIVTPRTLRLWLQQFRGRA